MELKGKVAIVTGGSSGIGRAICELFVKEHANVVVADIKPDREALHRGQKRNGLLTFIRTDVCNRVQVRRLLKETVAKFGGIDIVCNNVGIELMRALVDTTEAQWDKVFDTNLKGAFLISKYALPYLIAKKRGAIINIASQLGIVALEDLSAYCASKAAVIMLTKVLALEYARYGIRVNCICPGPTQTLGLDNSFNLEPEPEEAKKKFIKKVPLNRFARPEEIAQGALFLASDRSSFITGQSLVMDGGYIIQ